MMESIIQILDAVTWPLVILLAIPIVLVVLILFRKDWKRLLGRLKRIGYRGGGLEFEKGVAEGEELAKSDEEVVKSTEREESRQFISLFVSLVNDGRLIHTMEYKYLETILQHSPRDAVIAAWYHAENALVSLAIAAGIDDGENECYGAILEILVNMKLITNDTMRLYSQFSDLRDSVVDRDVTDVMDANAPARYIGVTLLLASRLQEAKVRAGKCS